jgi:hypothetical protein
MFFICHDFWGILTESVGKQQQVCLGHSLKNTPFENFHLNEVCLGLHKK